jgi:type II secretory pathway component PulC
VTLTACGSANPEPSYPTSDEAPPPAPEQKLPPLPAGHVWRVEVMKVMSPGMPVFLQRIDVDPVLVAGKFHGFRITALKGDPAFWRGSGLQVGDVITSVNGQPIERDQQAFDVWSQLATASELDVAYERGGQPKNLRLVIHDEDEIPGGAKPPPADAP